MTGAPPLLAARARLATVIAIATTAAALLAFACEPSGRACAPGDVRYCECPAGHGYQRCADDGSRYGACDCSGEVPERAGTLAAQAPPEDGGADADREQAGFLEPCDTNEDCSTQLCFGFNAYGPHCTLPCRDDIDCPPPSPGCNNRGACKLR